jgi:nicotinamidase-related amidase
VERTAGERRRDRIRVMDSQQSLDYASDYTLRFTLDAASTALVIIDMQYASACRTEGLGRLLQEQGRPEIGAERFDRIERVVLPNLIQLLGFFRSSNRPVIHVTLGSQHPQFLDIPRHLREFAKLRDNRVGSRSHEILDELKPVDGEMVFRKTTISAFASTGLESALRSVGITHLVLAGVSTNQCVDSTARDAVDRGWYGAIAEDCCASTTVAYHEAALTTFRRFYGRVVNAAEVIDELSGPDRPGRPAD